MKKPQLTRHPVVEDLAVIIAREPEGQLLAFLRGYLKASKEQDEMLLADTKDNDRHFTCGAIFQAQRLEVIFQQAVELSQDAEVQRKARG